MFLYLQVYCLLTDSIWWGSNAQNDKIGRFKGKTEADRTDGLTLADSQKNTVMSVAFRYTVLERDSTAWLRIILPLGKMLNIKDVYSHPLFYKGLDEKTGFRTR